MARTTSVPPLRSPAKLLKNRAVVVRTSGRPLKKAACLTSARYGLGETFDVGPLVVNLRRDSRPEASAPGVEVNLDAILDQQLEPEARRIVIGRAELLRQWHRNHRSSHVARRLERRLPAFGQNGGGVQGQIVHVLH